MHPAVCFIPYISSLDLHLCINTKKGRERSNPIQSSEMISFDLIIKTTPSRFLFSSLLFEIFRPDSLVESRKSLVTKNDCQTVNLIDISPATPDYTDNSLKISNSNPAFKTGSERRFRTRFSLDYFYIF